jgi:hypothetical protein
MGGWTTGQSMLRMGQGDQAPQGQQAFGGDAGVVRPSSTTPQGFDNSYLQNLATSAGGNFMRPPGGVLNFNPLGNLNDIQSSPLGGGNAPLFGLPQTLQQNAQNLAPQPASPSVGPAPQPPGPAQAAPNNGTPGANVPGAPSNSNLIFGPGGQPMPAPGSALWNAIANWKQAGNWNQVQVPANILAQYGLMYNPQGGFMFLNPPTTGGT